MSEMGDDLAGLVIALCMYIAWNLIDISTVDELFALLQSSSIGMTHGEAIILLVVLGVVGIWAFAQTISLVLDMIVGTVLFVIRSRHSIIHESHAIWNGMSGFYKENIKTNKGQQDL